MKEPCHCVPSPPRDTAEDERAWLCARVCSCARVCVRVCVCIHMCVCRYVGFTPIHSICTCFHLSPCCGRLSPCSGEVGGDGRVGAEGEPPASSQAPQALHPNRALISSPVLVARAASTWLAPILAKTASTGGQEAVPGQDMGTRSCSTKQGNGNHSMGRGVHHGSGRG